jgi:dephospho-CoA kinase
MPEQKRYNLLQELRGWTPEECARREKAQFSLDKKRKKADYIIWNAGDLPALSKEVKSLLSATLA